MRARRESAVASRDCRSHGARFRRRARRSRAAARAGPAPLLRQERLDTRLPHSRDPLIPVLVGDRAGGRAYRRRGARAQSQHVEQELATAARRSSSWRARSSTSTRRSSCRRSCSTSCSCRTLKRDGKTKTPSTAVEVLEELALTHELPRLILEWRALQKLKGTYIDALPQLVNPETGRIHTCFNQAVAATGRLSSSDPNLQNIPIRTELGREIRARVHRRAGPRADLRRLLADRAARARAPVGRRGAASRRSRRARDIHDRTALEGVRRPTAASSAHELRRRAKIINYALLYGKTAFTLAKDIGVTQQAAQEFIDAYFAGFPRSAPSSTARSRKRAQTGVVKTMFGRRRLVPELTSRNGQMRGRRRARRRQHADSGHRRRHPQARDDRRPRARSPPSPAAARG